MNPYAPPASPSQPLARARGTSVSSHVFLVLYPMASLVALGLDAAVYAGVSGVDGRIARLVAAAIGLAWLYARWAALPPERQVVGASRVGPVRAVLLHVVPVYGLYWIFAVQHTLCGALNDMLVDRERPATAPLVLANVAPAMQVVCGLGMTLLSDSAMFLVLAGCLAAAWTVYMVRVEQTVAALGEPDGGGEGGMSEVPLPG